ncbi:hypothetical protein BWQ96_06931 [Gracilariopsis chorda]|uniref:Uncharacterized protein n=1 Tax=Gracilariopsis chorda TaxID=448386 RepID=A0A2V3IMJ7_9FLOR|nr:hypothetical protein BWQ96_06931 [Gracilariopsis chorda]|eukprot:PXF43292.1 hypothetical protein BWQ96_06931 [Gracilariopsis chorda]
MKWEQKVVTQTLKTLSVNAFISWRMSQKRDLLQSKETFRSLKSYRQALNGIQSLADFVHDASKELIVYAQSLGTEDNAETLEVHQDEIQRLHTLARTRKRRRFVFFNGPDGISLRLNVKNHILKQQKGQQYCALCGVRGITENEEGWRGHRTTYKCLQCDVYLCTRIYRGLRKSCSKVWHSLRVLKPRSTAKPCSRSVFTMHGHDQVGDEREEGQSGPNTRLNTRVRETRTDEEEDLIRPRRRARK